MTNTIKWGRPLSGEECLSLELPGDTPVDLDGDERPAKKWCFNRSGRPYRLPADHPGYTILDYNAKHPEAPMKPWWGGYEAPGDWDGGSVLFRNGNLAADPASWTHPWIEGESGDFDIIAYRPRTEPESAVSYEDARHFSAEDHEKLAGLSRAAIGGSAEPDTVTIKRMTAAEAGQACLWFDNTSRAAWLDACRHFGIIRPEPTTLERFKAAHGDLTGDEAIEAALAFGRENCGG